MAIYKECPVDQHRSRTQNDRRPLAACKRVKPPGADDFSRQPWGSASCASLVLTMMRYRRSTAPGCFHESIWDDGRVLRLDEANNVDARNDKFRRRISLPRRVAWHRERLTLALRQHKNLRTELVLIFFSGLIAGRFSWFGTDKARQPPGFCIICAAHMIRYRQ